MFVLVGILSKVTYRSRFAKVRVVVARSVGNTQRLQDPAFWREFEDLMAAHISNPYGAVRVRHVDPVGHD